MITSETIALIEAWTQTRTGGIDPPHDVTDTAKHDRIVNDMRVNGWRGAPLVVDGSHALTGSHRYWAAWTLMYHEGIEVAIPCIDIADLCDLFDVDWNAHVEAYDDWIDCYIHVADLLPAEVVGYLGMDLQ